MLVRLEFKKTKSGGRGALSDVLLVVGKEDIRTLASEDIDIEDENLLKHLKIKR